MPKKSKSERIMSEYKHGTLHSGGGKHAPVVKSRKQAIAIMLNSTGKSKKSKRKR